MAKTRIAGVFGAALFYAVMAAAIVSSENAAAQQPQGDAKANAQNDAKATAQGDAKAAAQDAKSLAVMPTGADGKPMKFDVVSFRRTDKPGSSRVDLPETGDSIAYHGQPISRLIYFAYLWKSGPKLIGVPDWADNDLYEFQAKVAPEDIEIWQKATLNSKRLMMGALLADVLKLKVHDNDKEESVYELVVLPGGPKLKEHVDGQDKTFPDGFVLKDSNMHWITPVDTYFQAKTMFQLAEVLSSYQTAGRDVIDKTGIKGKYDFELPVPPGQITPEMLEHLPPEVQDRFHAESIFKAVEKLGLKLQPGKAASPGVVIDHIEKPEEN